MSDPYGAYQEIMKDLICLECFKPAKECRCYRICPECFKPAKECRCYRKRKKKKGK